MVVILAWIHKHTTLLEVFMNLKVNTKLQSFKHRLSIVLASIIALLKRKLSQDHIHQVIPSSKTIGVLATRSNKKSLERVVN